MSTSFGRYELLERISVGGMAEVFKASVAGAAGFEKIVAIKRILPTLSDPKFIAMFVQEARISSNLNHPNIGQVYDFGEIAGRYFIALEFVHGKDLRSIQDHLRGNKVQLPVGAAIRIVLDVCSALDYAHSKRDASGLLLRLIHRDVSPQNVLISLDGAVKLIDFGIAKALTEDPKTHTGLLKGKFAYMSPEMVEGKPIDSRSDLFSLGIVLYELATGQRLFFDRSDMGTLLKVRKADVPLPSRINPGLPQDLDAVVLRALARSPDERYQRAEELYEALDQLAKHSALAFSTMELSRWMASQFGEPTAHRENPAPPAPATIPHKALPTLEPEPALETKESGPARRRVPRPQISAEEVSTLVSSKSTDLAEREGEPRPTTDPDGAPAPPASTRVSLGTAELAELAPHGAEERRSPSRLLRPPQQPIGTPAVKTPSLVRPLPVVTQTGPIRPPSRVLRLDQAGPMTEGQDQARAQAQAQAQAPAPAGTAEEDHAATAATWDDPTTDLRRDPAKPVNEDQAPEPAATAEDDHASQAVTWDDPTHDMSAPALHGWDRVSTARYADPEKLARGAEALVREAEALARDRPAKLANMAEEIIVAQMVVPPPGEPAELPARGAAGEAGIAAPPKHTAAGSDSDNGDSWEDDPTKVHEDSRPGAQLPEKPAVDPWYEGPTNAALKGPPIEHIAPRPPPVEIIVPPPEPLTADGPELAIPAPPTPAAAPGARPEVPELDADEHATAPRPLAELAELDGEPHVAAAGPASPAVDGRGRDGRERDGREPPGAAATPQQGLAAVDPDDPAAPDGSAAPEWDDGPTVIEPEGSPALAAETSQRRAAFTADVAAKIDELVATHKAAAGSPAPDPQSSQEFISQLESIVDVPVVRWSGPSRRVEVSVIVFSVFLILGVGATALYFHLSGRLALIFPGRKSDATRAASAGDAGPAPDAHRLDGRDAVVGPNRRARAPADAAAADHRRRKRVRLKKAVQPIEVIDPEAGRE